MNSPLKNGIWNIPDTQKIDLKPGSPLQNACLAIFVTKIAIGFGFTIPIEKVGTNVPLEELSIADQKLLGFMSDPKMQFEIVEIVWNQLFCSKCCADWIIDNTVFCHDAFTILPFGLSGSNAEGSPPVPRKPNPYDY